jgi:hypothetical protein
MILKKDSEFSDIFFACREFICDLLDKMFRSFHELQDTQTFYHYMNAMIKLL